MNINEIYDNNIASMLLGYVLIKPELTVDKNLKLNKYLFDPQEFHRTLFIIVNNLYITGHNVVSIFDIMEFVERFPKQEEILQDNDVEEFIDTIKLLIEQNDPDMENVQAYADTLHKHHLLREYAKIGLDVDLWLAPTVFPTCTLKDITNYYKSNLLSIEKNFYVDKSIEEKRSGDGFENVLENLQSTPMYGFNTVSPILTQVCRGLSKGGLYTFHAPSGLGKTSFLVSTICNVLVTEMYDWDLHQWVLNPNRSAKAGLFLQFELGLDYELSPKIASFISGVPSGVILDGQYTDEQLQVLQHTAQVMRDSNIFIINEAEFTIESIHTLLAEYKTTHNIDIFVLDYLQSNSALIGEYVKEAKIAPREDMVLTNLASKLKDFAREFDIAVVSASQVNGNFSQTDVPDAGCVAGSRAMINKTDCSVAISSVKNKDKELLHSYFTKRNKFGWHEPNMVLSVFKARFSSYPANLKIFVYADLGVCRIQDVGVTTWDKEPILELNGRQIQFALDEEYEYENE